MVSGVKCAQISFLLHMQFRRLYVDSLRIVNRGESVANPDYFDARLQTERKRRDRADIPKPLNNRSALFRVELEHIHGTLDQVNDPAAGGLSSTFGTAN